MPPMGQSVPERLPAATVDARAAHVPPGRVNTWARLILGTACGALAALLSLLRLVPDSLDDAFIVLVHARNLAEGEGFVLQPGGPLVAGFTSLFDVLQKSLLSAVGTPDALRSAAWLGLGWLVLYGALAGARWAKARHRGVAAATALALATAPGVAEGTAFVLETPVFACVWSALLMQVAAGRRRTAFVLALVLPLVRPEGHLLGPLAWLAAEWTSRTRSWPRSSSQEAHTLHRRARGPALRRALAEARVPLLVQCGLQGCMLVARKVVFGAPFPLSYYAKASDSRLLELRDGAAYIGRFLGTPSGLLLAVALVVALRPIRPSGPIPASDSAAASDLAAAPDPIAAHDPIAARAWASARLLAVLAGAALLGVLLAGGDGYRGARLLAPVTIAAWCAVLHAAQARPRAERRLIAALALGSALVPLARPLAAPAASFNALRSGPVGLEAIGPDAGFVSALERALEGREFEREPVGSGGAETWGPEPVPWAERPILAHRHGQRLAWFRPRFRLLDLTGLTSPEVAALPAPGPVRFGRDALVYALAQRVEALHLDHAFFRARGWWEEAPIAALSTPAVASMFLGEPLPTPDLAARLAAVYCLATLPDQWGPGRHINLLVRRDLAARFRAAGFLVGP